MSFTVRPLSRALGAEIQGLDLRRPPSPETAAALRQAWADHLILLFRGQELNHEEHVAFTRTFGDLDRHDAIPTFRHSDHPEILPVTNFEESTGKRLAVGRQWHSDLSTTTRPAKGSLLRCCVTPSVGGDTMFCNMYRAWETLSPTMQAFLDGLWALHDMAVARETVARRTPEELAAIRRRNPPVLQPVARVHDVTGRKALYVSEMTTVTLEGMTPEECGSLLRFLYAHAVRPENVYRHRWQPGDMVLWDNRCAMHIALADYDQDERRVMYRTTLLGEPSGRLPAAAV